MIGRFAPSPSGRMHAGNAFCALAAWLSVRAQGGHFILRIEDLDTQRCKREYAEQLEDDLRWLGLDWDEGGLVGGANYLQSACTSFYAQALNALSAQNLTYPCFCTRTELHAASAPHRSDGQILYLGTCRNLTPAEIAAKSALRNPAIRLKLPFKTISFTDDLCGPFSENLAKSCGDIVLRRSDGVYAYQLAVVVDDARMGVTEVVRGQDLLDSTPRQLYLYQLLGATPPSFLHIPLLCAPDGRRLAKRDYSLDFCTLRNNYRSPESFIGKLAYFLGLLKQPETISAQELISLYSPQKLRKSNIVLTDKEYQSLSGRLDI